MDIEKYAEVAPQFYNYSIPSLISKYLKTGKYKTLLDCGCGDGSFIFALKKKGYLRKLSVLAVDLSRNRINLVKKIDPNIKAYVDNAEQLKHIKKGVVDFFVSMQVIEHVDDTKMIKTIERVTKKGALVYTATVHKKWYGWYFYRNKGKWVLDPTHLREYTKDSELLKLFNPKKFEFLEHTKSLQWFPIFHLILKVLRVKNRTLFNNPLFAQLGKIKIPIIGYYNWELVFKRK